MIKHTRNVGYRQNTGEDFAITQLKKDLAIQHQSGEYKLLSEVRLAFYRTQLSGVPLDPSRFHYQLAIPTEGGNFSYYNDFKKFVQYQANGNLLREGDKMFLLFKSVIVTITKEKDIIPSPSPTSDLSSYSITCTVAGSSYPCRKGNYNAIITAVLINQMLSEIFNFSL